MRVSVAGCAHLCRNAAIFLAIPLWSWMTITDNGLSFSVVMLYLKNIISVEGPTGSLKQIGLKLGFTKACGISNKTQMCTKNYMFHKNHHLQPKTKNKKNKKTTKQKPVP